MEFKSRQGLGIFLFTPTSRPALGLTQPPIQWVPGVLSLAVKRQGREANHSSPSNAEVENVWSYNSTPQYDFMGWCSVEAQGQLYLYLSRAHALNASCLNPFLTLLNNSHYIHIFIHLTRAMFWMVQSNEILRENSWSIYLATIPGLHSAEAI
jgi:hypothetical protein